MPVLFDIRVWYEDTHITDTMYQPGQIGGCELFISATVSCHPPPPGGGRLIQGTSSPPSSVRREEGGEVGSTPELDLGVASRSSGRKSLESPLGLGLSMEKVTSFAK
jgi:hypothetical protein